MSSNNHFGSLWVLYVLRDDIYVRYISNVYCISGETIVNALL